MSHAVQNETQSVLVTKLQINCKECACHLDWLSQLMMQGIEFGAVGAEIFPPLSVTASEWMLVLHFSQPAHIDAWLQCEGRKKLMDILTPALKSKQVAITEARNSNFAIFGGISIAVVTHVKSGCEEAYFEHERKYQAAQARMPGYHGAYVQPPLQGANGNWITIIRFDSPHAMDQWFCSDERKKLVHESDQLVKSTAFQNVRTSFPGWFPDEENSAKGPPNWKTALLILLGLYPSVMLVILYFLPLMQGSSLALNNFIGNILTVAFTTWVSMPFFIKLYKAWLFPTDTTPKWVGSVSLVSILSFFVIEVAFFWSYY